MEISVCYIVRDCEDTIARSLESVKWANEIIVVDTGSKDNTVKICSQYDNVKIYHYEWNDDFASARNYSLSKATKDYILVVDDDETVEDLVLPVEGDYMICSIEDIRKGRSEWFKSIRYFKNTPEIRYEGIKQATVDKSVKGMVQSDGKCHIRHYGYDMTPEQWHKKALYNLEMHLKQFAIEPDNLTVEYYLSLTYKYFKEWRNCIDYGMLALQKDINSQLKAHICIALFESYNSLNLTHIGIKWLLKSIQYVPMQILGRAYLIQVLEQEGNQLLADEHFAIIKKIITNKNSQLPNDYYYSEAELINLRSKQNGI